MADHILVATDLSKRSELAIVRAMDLGKFWNASITVLHVVDEDQPEEIIRQKIEQAKTYLEHQAVQHYADYGSIEIVVQAGEIHEVINGIAREKDSRLIVMGAHRWNIILDVFRGTTIERVLHTGTVPVLMVVRDPYNKYDTALFGVDMDRYSKFAIRSAYRFGLVDTARLTVVHAYAYRVLEETEDAGMAREESSVFSGAEYNQNADRVYTYLSDTPLADKNYRLVLEETDPAQLILKVAGDLDADLIVIGTRSAKGIRRVILGSVAEHVLRHSHSDVLVVPPRAEDRGEA